MAKTITGDRPWFVAKLTKYIAQVLGNTDTVKGFTTAGGTVIPAGTVQEVLEEIADLADPSG